MRKPLIARNRAVVSIGRVAFVVSTASMLALAGCSSSNGASGSTGDTTATSSSPSTAPTSSAPVTSSAPPTATPTPLKTTTTEHLTPWKDKNADFGWIRSAVAVSGGVQITFDRASWLLPDQIAAWNKANPGHTVEAADDYAIGNVSTKLRTFLVRDDAVIFGSVALTGDQGPTRLTAAQFVAGESNNPDGVTCWLYHEYGGLTGDVVQVEEQFRP